jgi:hypothetical protein
MRRQALLIALLLFGAWAGTAHAAEPFTLAATDVKKEGDLPTHCHLSRNAEKCDGAGEKTFRTREHDAGGPRVLVRGERVVLLTTRCCSPPSRDSGTIAVAAVARDCRVGPAVGMALKATLKTHKRKARRTR